jgi:carbon starvation protein CstA
MNNTDIKRTTLFSLILMVLTSFHHVYGALVYNTPWRFHVLFISIPVAIAILLLSARLSGKMDIKFWTYWALVLFPTILMLGVFEGLYNHLLKDFLYFTGFSRETLQTLFPPPKYEMPNDFLFELTGILQGFVAINLMVHFVRFSGRYFRLESRNL